MVSAQVAGQSVHVALVPVHQIAEGTAIPRLQSSDQIPLVQHQSARL
jgi:hypothetical protein